MKKIILFLVCIAGFSQAFAQRQMTPELLWQLGRVSAVGITIDGQSVVYRVSTPNIAEDKSSVKLFKIPIAGGTPQEISNAKEIVKDHNLSPDGKFSISIQDIKQQKVFGKDFYPDLEKSNAFIYESLNYRHWDEWEDGAYSHLFVHPVTNGNVGEGKDIMENEPFDCPQKPFGGEEDFTWSADGKYIVYVTKKKSGTAYALSTNTDLFAYEVSSDKTINLTESMMGYDTNPVYSAQARWHG